MKYVIGLGGSIICPKEINTSFLKRFHQFINKETAKGRKFVIITGGGGIARRYQKAALKLKVSSEKRDWIGIEATKLNAELLKSLFVKADPVLFDKRFKIKSFRCPVLIGSGWTPGWSTDYVAVQTAVDLNIDKVIFLGKPDYVYTSDFVKDKKAKPIKDIKWRDYFKIIPSSWTPGLSVPVDPVAARLAEKKKVTVIVASASDLNNVKKILENKPFKGTILHD